MYISQKILMTNEIIFFIRISAYFSIILERGQNAKHMLLENLSNEKNVFKSSCHCLTLVAIQRGWHPVVAFHLNNLYGWESSVSEYDHQYSFALHTFMQVIHVKYLWYLPFFLWHFWNVQLYLHYHHHHADWTFGSKRAKAKIMHSTFSFLSFMLSINCPFKLHFECTLTFASSDEE